MSAKKEVQLKIGLHEALTALVAYDRVPVVVPNTQSFNADTKLIADAPEGVDPFADVLVGDYVAGTGVAAESWVASKIATGGQLEVDTNFTAAGEVDITMNGGEAAEAVSITITAPTVIIPIGTKLTFYLVGETPAYVVVITRAECAADATELLVHPMEAAMATAAVAKFRPVAMSFYRPVGEGDGSEVTFTATLVTKDSKPLIPGSVVISDGTENFSDDGNGILTGDAATPGTGTVNYLTKAVSVTFAAFPTNGDAIYASFLSGDFRTQKVIPSSEGNMGAASRHVQVIDTLNGQSFYVQLDVERQL